MGADEELNAVESLEESILNAVADRPESSTRTVAHQVSVSHQAVCRVLSENRLHLFHYQRVQYLNPENNLRQLPVDGTAMCATAELQKSYAELL
ncbi:hypothetical protein TNCV_2426691 [Trichonephila clavipes]|nr:hypothetical protein TNCV_2426691 [Trichonephila clavipes]